jgi:chaperone modulatory protein CbpM
MTQHDIVTGVLLDEVALSLDELAQACAVETQWVVERVEAGILGDGSMHVSSCRFTSHDLTRARRLRQMERDFDAVPELAALVADLLEEVERLKERIKAAGLTAD